MLLHPDHVLEIFAHYQLLVFVVFTYISEVVGDHIRELQPLVTRLLEFGKVIIQLLD